jgi:uncharacterized protein (DUF1499 family)
VALAAVLVSLLTLAVGRAALDARDLAFAIAGLALGAVLAYVPWHYNRLRSAVPRIHDITTDTTNPPPFQAVLSARAAEKAATEVYEGPELARQQQAAYPDLAPLVVEAPPAKAFDEALAAARAMPGWRVVAAEPGAGRIEASQKSRWFGFTDDIVIRVAAEGPRSRIDMRSLSRQGRSDFGINAARIRAYMGTLRRRLA